MKLLICSCTPENLLVCKIVLSVSLFNLMVELYPTYVDVINSCSSASLLRPNFKQISK